MKASRVMKRIASAQGRLLNVYKKLEEANRYRLAGDLQLIMLLTDPLTETEGIADGRDHPHFEDFLLNALWRARTGGFSVETNESGWTRVRIPCTFQKQKAAFLAAWEEPSAQEADRDRTHPGDGAADAGDQQCEHQEDSLAAPSEVRDERLGFEDQEGG